MQVCGVLCSGWALLLENWGMWFSSAEVNGEGKLLVMVLLSEAAGTRLPVGTS